MTSVFNPDLAYQTTETLETVSGLDVLVTISLLIGAVLTLLLVITNIRGKYKGRVGSMVNKLNQANLKNGAKRFSILTLVSWFGMGVVIVLLDFPVSFGWWLVLTPLTALHIYTTRRVSNKYITK